MAILEIIVVVLNIIIVCSYTNYNFIPIKLIKAIPISPVIIKVMPNPLRGPGT
jgi:uncharacterized membrane protein